jgi:DNA-binding transcriptional LysR family regulator
MDWDDVRHFLALARTGSVRAAGASLGVSHSTVLRRVEALEEQLAVRLFDRNRDGYTLTDAGRQMLPGAERIEREMSALERGLAGQDERLAGPVAVTCCDTYISELLVEELAAFCAQHPDIELCLTADSRPFDLSKREADIAIRALPLEVQPPLYLIGQKLGPVVVANYVAQAHAIRLDPEREGATPRWVSFADRATFEALIAESSYPHVPAWGAFSSLVLMVQVTRQGLGLALLPTYVGDREPALQRLPHPDLRHMADLWLLSHPDLRDNARLRATRAAIARAFERHGPLFRGQRPTDAPARPEIAPDGRAAPSVR